MPNNTVRTRFAPSPTGYMHVGNLRTALYAYLIARKAGGAFILRIEDTDQQRYVEGTVDIIYETLRQTGLHWDEGPDVGGDYGPYVQSERRDSYLKYALELVDNGAAYFCFCGKKEDVDDVRDDPAPTTAQPVGDGSSVPQHPAINRYDGRCRNIPPDEAKKRAESEPYVIRQKMPLDGETSFDDAVYGRITIENAELEDQILIKSDGMPTYNFANVVTTT